MAEALDHLADEARRGARAASEPEREPAQALERAGRGGARRPGPRWFVTAEQPHDLVERRRRADDLARDPAAHQRAPQLDHERHDRTVDHGGPGEVEIEPVAGIARGRAQRGPDLAGIARPGLAGDRDPVTVAGDLPGQHPAATTCKRETRDCCLRGRAGACRCATTRSRSLQRVVQAKGGRARGVIAVLALATVATCTLNQSGRLFATRLGDTSQLAVRDSPLRELRQACGARGRMRPDAAKVIVRVPYLQHVTSSSAVIGWRTSAPAAQRVDVTTPDGGAVGSVPARVAPGSRRGGAEQVWAHLGGLEPDTVYCYVLADGAHALSERIGFRTAPLAASRRTIRFLAFGDSGWGGSDQLTLRDRMDEVPYELMIHTGDVAYDDGTHAEIEATVFGPYGELFRHIPFFPAAGNHDLRADRGAPFQEVFALPFEDAGLAYAYDWGRIHFAALDTEADYAAQAAWLDRDLSRTTLPWKIVYLHRPPYSSGHHGSDLPLRQALAPVLARHGVQLVLAGHDHNYERMIPRPASRTSSPGVAGGAPVPCRGPRSPRSARR